MLVAALTVAALAVLVLMLSAHRARDAARQAIAAIAASRRQLQPALVLARDDAQRAALIRPPDRR